VKIGGEEAFCTALPKKKKTKRVSVVLFCFRSCCFSYEGMCEWRDGEGRRCAEALSLPLEKKRWTSEEVCVCARVGECVCVTEHCTGPHLNKTARPAKQKKKRNRRKQQRGRAVRQVRWCSLHGARCRERNHGKVERRRERKEAVAAFSLPFLLLLLLSALTEQAKYFFAQIHTNTCAQ
jgi:hypothetical protein